MIFSTIRNRTCWQSLKIWVPTTNQHLKKIFKFSSLLSDPNSYLRSDFVDNCRSLDVFPIIGLHVNYIYMVRNITQVFFEIVHGWTVYLLSKIIKSIIWLRFDLLSMCISCKVKAGWNCGKKRTMRSICCLVWTAMYPSRKTDNLFHVFNSVNSLPWPLYLLVQICCFSFVFFFVFWL